MAEMSGDEVGALLVSGFIALATTWGWIYAIVMPMRFGNGPARFPVVFAPVLGWLAILVVLRTLASADVRDEPLYLGFYLLMGIAWVGVGLSFLPWCGLSARDDVGERRNAAATPVMIGAALGLSACYAGANIGDGPGWWCVVWAGGLGTALWFVALALVAGRGHLAETVTVERDPAAGLRLGVFLFLAGIICGRGAAGDWTNALMTVVEFKAAWPLVPLVLVALMGEKILRPTPERPLSSWSASLVVVVLELIVLLVGLALTGPLPDGYRLPAQGVER